MAILAPGLILSQEVFTLSLNQPPSLNLSISDTIFSTQGTLIDLDTVYVVDGGIAYTREWSFNNGSETVPLLNSLVTASVEGVYYLSLIDEFQCTTLDSVALSFDLSTGVISAEPNIDLQIQLYPNPNAGVFELVITNGLPTCHLEVVNASGIPIYSSIIYCNKFTHREVVSLTPIKPGLYFVLIKHNKSIIYRHKIIILSR